MRICSLAILAFACILAARPASATPITLQITYEGMSATAENEISSVTLTETGGSFTHPISNISPELLQLVTLGVALSNLTFTAFDGAVSLGGFSFGDVLLTGLSPAGDGTSEQVSFMFNQPSQGLYTIDYPGISPTAENGVTSLTLDQTGASFEHPISNISPQLLQFVSLGTVLSSVTFSPVDVLGPFGEVRFENVLFTGIAFSGSLGLLEDVSFTFDRLAIEPPATAAVPEPGTWLLMIGGAFALARRRRARVRH